MQADMSRVHSACESIKIVCTVRLPRHLSLYYLLLHFFPLFLLLRSSRWVPCIVAKQQTFVWQWHDETFTICVNLRVFCRCLVEALVCAHFLIGWAKTAIWNELKKKISAIAGKMKLCSGQYRCTLLFSPIFFSFGHKRKENKHFCEPISLNVAH